MHFYRHPYLITLSLMVMTTTKNENDIISVITL